MSRRVVLWLVVGCVWLVGAYLIQTYVPHLLADPLPNPALAALRFQTGPAQQATITPIPTNTIVVLPTATTRVLSPATATQVNASLKQVTATLPVSVAPLLQTPPATARPGLPVPGPGGQITPVGLPQQPPPGQPTLNPTQATAQAPLPGQPTTRPGGLPPTIPPVQGTRILGAPAPTGVAVTVTVTPTVAATGVRATATTSLVGLRTFAGRIISKDLDTRTIVIRIPNQGEVTVTPGDDTEIRRDSIATTFADLDVGDQATLVLGPNDELLRILVTTPPVDASPTAADSASSSSTLTVVWQALLGLVMMGIVLIIDSELRIKFMAALLEPSGAYPTGRR